MRGQEDESAWPAAGRALLAELTARPGRLCLIGSDPSGPGPGSPGRLVERLSADLGLGVASVGATLTDRPRPPAAAELPDMLAGATVLVDLDVLFWPDLAASPLGMLRSLARRGPIVALWPGPIAGRRATYSRPGRPDHHDTPLTDAIVLRPRWPGSRTRPRSPPRGLHRGHEHVAQGHRVRGAPAGSGQAGRQRDELGGCQWVERVLMANESSAVQWLRQLLKSRRSPQPFDRIQPEYFRELETGLPDWEDLPDLK